MSNLVFPTLPGASIEIDRATSFKTNVQVAASGKEYTSRLMLSPLYEITIKFDLLRISQSELQTLDGFFHDMGGQFDWFLFYDYNDSTNNSVTDQIIGVADGVKTQFQLGRLPGVSLFEPCKNIKTLTNVKVNGVTKTLGTDYTVSSRGLVTFTYAPSAGNITWTGSYYYQCRFNEDITTFNRISYNIWANKEIKFRANLGNKFG
jgi:uncharacterized protein (TIGR02217 family)